MVEGTSMDKGSSSEENMRKSRQKRVTSEAQLKAFHKSKKNSPHEFFSRDLRDQRLCVQIPSLMNGSRGVIGRDIGKAKQEGEPFYEDGEFPDSNTHTTCFSRYEKFIKVPVAIGGLGLSAGVRFRKDVPSGGLANVAANVMNHQWVFAPEDTRQLLWKC
ncbi:2,3-bisphosphoglycerate-independent phosphoglycerate mutase [Tanacetum coccineum]